MDATTRLNLPCLRWECSFLKPIAVTPSAGLNVLVQAQRLTNCRAERGHHLETVYLPNCVFAASTIFSGSNPNFLCNCLSGAEAPNVFMPITFPLHPT